MKKKTASAERFTVTYGSSKATVYRRDERRWAIAWHELGKRKTSTITGSKKDAEAKARKLITEASRINHGLTPARTASKVEADALERLAVLIGDRELTLAISDLEAGVDKAGVWKTAMRHLHAYEPEVSDAPIDGLVVRFMRLYDNLEPSSAANPKKEFNTTMAAFPDLLLSEVDLDFLEDWIDRGDPAPNTYNTRLIVWRNFLSRCRDWGFIREGTRHAGDKMKKRAASSGSPSILTLEQLTRSLDVLEGSHLAGFSIGCFAGLRPSEISSLKWEDVQEDYIFVRSETSKKNKAERYVPVQPRLWAILKPLKGDLENSHAKGNVCTFYQWKKIAQHLKRGDDPILPEWPVDVLRHSFISYRLAQTSNIAQVADEAGNSADVIMQHYRRPLKKEVGAEWFEFPCAE